MRKGKKISKLKRKIRLLKADNARLQKGIDCLAGRAEQAESILRREWADSGEENERLEKAGRILHEAYMSARPSPDEFWRLEPSPYSHYERISSIIKRAGRFSPKDTERAKDISCGYTPWEKAKDIPLEELAHKVKEEPVWDLGLLRELCRRARMLREWQEEDCLDFERVAALAAKKLGVDIGIPDSDKAYVKHETREG